ncbi:hypothetical protein Q5752_002635 [Cryptotrichosporon argae]
MTLTASALAAMSADRHLAPVLRALVRPDTVIFAGRCPRAAWDSVHVVLEDAAAGCRADGDLLDLGGAQCDVVMAGGLSPPSAYDTDVLAVRRLLARTPAAFLDHAASVTFTVRPPSGGPSDANAQTGIEWLVRQAERAKQDALDLPTASRDRMERSGALNVLRRMSEDGTLEFQVVSSRQGGRKRWRRRRRGMTPWREGSGAA